MKTILLPEQRAEDMAPVAVRVGDGLSCGIPEDHFPVRREIVGDFLADKPEGQRDVPGIPDGEFDIRRLVVDIMVLAAMPPQVEVAQTQPQPAGAP